MKLGIKELPEIIEEKIRNPFIKTEELRSKYGNLKVLNCSRLEIYLERKINPSATLESIGNKFNLTRERVRQILKEGNMPTKAAKPSPYKFNCLNCKKPSKKKFCNKECRANYLRTDITCEICGRKKRVLISHIRNVYIKRGYQHVFCSKYCQGIWFATNHGFIAHPENRPSKMKLD